MSEKIVTACDKEHYCGYEGISCINMLDCSYYEKCNCRVCINVVSNTCKWESSIGRCENIKAWPENQNIESEIEASRSFAKAFKWAMQLGMEIEFFVSFMDHMNNGYSIVESIFHANREWDL